MHGGEAETSIPSQRFPEVVRPSFPEADHLADERRYLLTVGMRPYAPDGIIGLPSLATADKGRRLLEAFSRLAKEHVAALGEQWRAAGEVQPSTRGENFLYVFKPAPAADRAGLRRTACAAAPPAPLPGGRAPIGPPAMRRQEG